MKWVHPPPSMVMTKVPATLWHPPVIISHVSKEKQAVVKQLLYEGSKAFACDDNDTLHRKSSDDSHCEGWCEQCFYAAIPKEIKEYIQDLLPRELIVKSKSPYAVPVLCVHKKRMGAWGLLNTTASNLGSPSVLCQETLLSQWSVDRPQRHSSCPSFERQNPKHCWRCLKAARIYKP